MRSSNHTGTRWWKNTYLLLSIILLLGIGFRFAESILNNTLYFDETGSLIHASCHFGEYVRVEQTGLPPAGVWIKASEWKRMFTLSDGICPAKIGYDMAHYEIHPPMYFWMLNIWVYIFGSSLWIVRSLNILIYLLSAVFLFALARRILGNDNESLAVIFVWSLSPATIYTSTQARQYELLCLWTILFVLQIVGFINKREKVGLKGICLMVVTACGILTHYYFFILVAGGLVFLAFSLVREDKHRMYSGFMCILSGVALFIMIHPNFYMSFINQRTHASDFNIREIQPRLLNVIITMSKFFVPLVDVNYYSAFALTLITLTMIPLLSLLSLIGLMKYSGKKICRPLNITPRRTKGFFVLYFLLWCFGCISVFYLCQQMHPGAMGPKYLSMVWPFMAFTPIFAFRFVRWRLKHYLALLLCFSLLLSAFMVIYLGNWGFSGIIKNAGIWVKSLRDGAQVELLQDYDAIIISDLGYGKLVRLLYFTPDSMDVYADNPSRLLQNPRPWSHPLSNKTLYAQYFIKQMFMPNGIQSDPVLDTLKRDNTVTLIDDNLLNHFKIYKIEPNSQH